MNLLIVKSACSGLFSVLFRVPVKVHVRVHLFESTDHIICTLDFISLVIGLQSKYTKHFTFIFKEFNF